MSQQAIRQIREMYQEEIALWSATDNPDCKRKADQLKKLLSLLEQSEAEVQALGCLSDSMPIEQSDQWQPIESAPRDGTVIIGKNRDGEVRNTRFSKGIYYASKRQEWEKWDKYSVDVWYPVEWQPLPEPPKEQG